MMSFETALTAAKSGESLVARDSWHKGDYICVSSAEFLIGGRKIIKADVAISKIMITHKGILLLETRWTPSSNDMFAMDWGSFSLDHLKPENWQ